jgi:hypothetical protein
MKRLIVMLAVVVAAGLTMAWDQVNVSVEGLNVKGGTLKIDGTAVTGTAAQLNTAVATAGAGTIDGEIISNDTIDDDSIDFADVTGADLTLTDCGAISSSGTITFDTTSVAKDFTISSDYTMIMPPHYISVTNGQALAHVATIYRITSASAITCSVANAATAGEVFKIFNTGAGDVSFLDAANLKLSSDAVLGTDDTLELYSVDGTNWTETAQVDN